jgi:hypothetical protein
MINPARLALHIAIHRISIPYASICLFINVTFAIGTLLPKAKLFNQNARWDTTNFCVFISSGYALTRYAVELLF